MTKHLWRKALTPAAWATGGAALGGGTYATIGGIGIAATGTAVGITAGPFIAIGAGVGLVGYGIYSLGKQMGRRSFLEPLDTPADVSTAGYVVFEDLADATETKVHLASCRYYQERDRSATTVRWHGPMQTVDDARRRAEQIADGKRYGAKDADCCMRS